MQIDPLRFLSILSVRTLCINASLVCLLAFSLSLTTAEAADGVRTSLSATVLSVDKKANTVEGRTSYEGKRMDVVLEIPRERYIYYRWDGSKDEIKRGDKVEISGTLSKDGKQITAERVGLFKGKYTRAGDYLSVSDDGRIQLRGKLGFNNGVWSASSEDSVYTVVFPEGVNVLIHEDATAADLEKGQKISFTGTLKDERMDRLSQLYIRQMKPGYVPDTAMARGGHRLFEGKVRIVDRELKLFVASGELDGETIPMTVRWVDKVPLIYAVTKGGMKDIEPGQAVLVPRDKVKGDANMLFVLPDSAGASSAVSELSDFREVVVGEVISHGETLGVKIAGAGQVRTIPQHMEIMLAEEKGLDAVKVGQDFLALGFVPDDGRWLMDDPRLVLLF